MPVAIYAGSFDPPTKGHLDLILRASTIFDKVVVAIGIHPTKVPLFTLEERLDLLRQITVGINNVEITSFRGLLIDFTQSIGAKVIVRGLRAATDFESELQTAHANADIGPSIETIFLPTRTNYGFVSASLVREIASHHGDVLRYVEPPVAEALRKKYSQRR